MTGCASCTLALKDYEKWFKGEPEEETATRLAKKVKHISEFALDQETVRPSSKKSSVPQKVTYHSSCHLRAAGVTKQPRQLLTNLPGVDYVEMQDADRCAGGAGTYIVKDYTTSQKIFQRKKTAIHQSQAEVVATSCPACMIQLKNGLPAKTAVKHIAQVLLENMDETESG